MQYANGWLAFELGVLRRMKFSSAPRPFRGEQRWGGQLKRWKVRVSANDPMIWSYTKAMGLVENQVDRLDEQDLGILLEDAYVPRDKVDNPALLKWFNEVAPWGFDKVRF